MDKADDHAPRAVPKANDSFANHELNLSLYTTGNVEVNHWLGVFGTQPFPIECVNQPILEF